MPGHAETFALSLGQQSSDITEKCTRCGKCVAACPTPKLTGIAEIDTETVAGGVIDILNEKPFAPSSETWARACCGTGHCIDACPEGINPRAMLTLARGRLNAGNADARTDGRAGFQDMSRAVRMLSKLQLPPDVLERLNPRRARQTQDDVPEIIFYTGCNLLRTPHIGLLCLDVLDKLGVRYDVYGGPGNCCGILQFRPGDSENAGRQIMATIERFDATGAGEVLAWCPTCHIQFGEVAIPGMAPEDAPSFDLNMFPVYLARRLETLRPFMNHAVEKKVALMEFPGARGVTAAVSEILSAIPGVELVDLGLERAGYQLSALNTVPEYRTKMMIDLFAAADAAGVDALLSVFHADHRELASHAGTRRFDILNYMDIIGAALGIERDDTFKRLKLMQDVDAIVAEQADNLAAHGLSLEEARDAVRDYILGEQLLPKGAGTQATP